MYLLICFLLVIFMLAFAGYKQVFVDNINKQSISFVTNSTFNSEESHEDGWIGKIITDWKDSLLPKSVRVFFI